MNSIQALRVGEGDHRLRELQIIAAECSTLDCQRLRERRFRSLRIVADLIVEDAEPIEPLREREIILFQDSARLREELIRLRRIVFDDIEIKTQVLQRDRVGGMLVAQRIGGHVTGSLRDSQQWSLWGWVPF